MVSGLVGGTMAFLFVPVFLFLLAYGIWCTVLTLRRIRQYPGVFVHALAGATVNTLLILLLVLMALWLFPLG
jgi:hypothetical protein